MRLRARRSAQPLADTGEDVMRINPRILIMLCAMNSLTANADAPFAVATFVKLDPTTRKARPMPSAKLNDKDVCLNIKDVSTADGDHALRLTIYDGGGREVYQAVSTVTAKDKKWQSTTCYGFKSGRDLSGTWWYVAELDDQPLVSKELVVNPASPASVG
jgi:hypothetical protein